MQAYATDPNRSCTGRRKDGEPCSARALPSGDFCFSHAPQLREKRDAARRAGGRNSSHAARLKQLMPPRLVPVFDVLQTALEEVHSGTLAPARANALANVARAMATVLQVGELEERVRRLEQGDGT